MPDILIMRGQTVHNTTETLNFGGRTPGYGYHLIDLRLYPSTSITNNDIEATCSITASKTAMDPENPNFNDEGLIGTFFLQNQANVSYPSSEIVVINDLFIITQDLILKVYNAGGGNDPVNWQCKFEKVKLSASAEAVANFNQFTIFDD
jgi:hypothetical protein